MTPEEIEVFNDIMSNEPVPTFYLQLDRIEKFLQDFQSEVYRRLDCLEATLQSRRQEPHNTASSGPCLPSSSRPPLADVNGAHHVSAATDAKIQAILMNPRITGPVHLGTELAKVIFTEEEMAGSTLTGRKVNGQCRQLLDTGKLSIIDRLVQQRFSMGEAEFAGIRSAIRDSLANRCKYLRLKLAPRNIDII